MYSEVEELADDSNLEAEIHAMEPHGVTFELQVPEGMNTSEVSDILELFEVLQNDIPEFDDMLMEAVNTIESDCPEVSIEGNQTTSQPSELPVVDELHEQPQLQDAISKNASRFKVLDDQQLLEIEQNQCSTSTKKNTKWDVGVFNAWCQERINEVLDFQTVPISVLNENLRKFYAEAQPKNIENRAKKMSDDQAAEYHKNSTRNVRSALNRHLKDIGRLVDIVKDNDFRSSNAMLSSKMKYNLKKGLSRPTKHHPIIPNVELSKIYEFLSKDNPVALRFRVWYALAIHFVSRGCEFHHQHTMSSLKFQRDENDIQYVTIGHETQQKNYQGGLDDHTEEASDKRLYATGNINCPVKALENFVAKTDANATALFNECHNDALQHTVNADKWFTATPVKQKKITTFMADICKNSGVTRYTAHSLRATAITAMSDAGLIDRNIMFMSDHKCEESLKSYCRRPSTTQKQMISTVLEHVATGEKNLPIVPVSTNAVIPATVPAVVPAFDTPMIPGALTSNQSLNINRENTGFGAYSVFKDCNFHFHAGTSAQ